MPRFSVPRNPQPLDFAPVQVGKPCIQPRYLGVADLIHHQMLYRMKGWAVTAYQIGSSEITTPTRITSGTVAPNTARFLSGANTRFISGRVLHLGGVASTSTDPELTLTSSGESYAMGPIADAAAPGADFDETSFGELGGRVEVNENTIENIDLEQANGTDLVRIVSAVWQEFPRQQVDTTDDAVSVNLDQCEPGTDIIAAEYEDLPVAVQAYRRFHKKLLIHQGHEVQCTTTAANWMDHTTRVTGNPPATLQQWDIYPSVNLPETTGISVTCAVLAKTSANNGTVRFAFGGGNIDVGPITALGYYTATGTCAKLVDTLAIMSQLDAAGTLTVYGAWVHENVEAY